MRARQIGHVPAKIRGEKRNGDIFDLIYVGILGNDPTSNEINKSSFAPTLKPNPSFFKG